MLPIYINENIKKIKAKEKSQNKYSRLNHANHAVLINRKKDT
jgi:hypothetical protein